MKTLQNHTLIYDDDCPMCNLYSNGMMKCGMLDENGREAFSNISENSIQNLDYHRAKNEIALVDYTTNSVVYGVDSLLVIIGNSFPWLAKLAKISPIYWFSKKLYKFISYNRKQIVPSAKHTAEIACIPDFNLKYRLFYIAFVWLFSIGVLSLYNAKMFPDFQHHFALKSFICTMQIVWQTVFLRNFLGEKFWDYLGNMMTVSLIGTLILIPALFLNFPKNFYFIYFGFTVFIMVLEHIRRCRILKVGWIPTISWIVFRTVFGVVLLKIVGFI